MWEKELKCFALDTPWVGESILLLTFSSEKQSLTFWMRRGVPKSEPPWSLKPQGCLSVLESWMFRLPAALMAEDLRVRVTDHLSAIPT